MDVNKNTTREIPRMRTTFFIFICIFFIFGLVLVKKWIPFIVTCSSQVQAMESNILVDLSNDPVLYALHVPSAPFVIAYDADRKVLEPMPAGDSWKFIHQTNLRKIYRTVYDALNNNKLNITVVLPEAQVKIVEPRVSSEVKQPSTATPPPEKKARVSSTSETQTDESEDDTEMNSKIHENVHLEYLSSNMNLTDDEKFTLMVKNGRLLPEYIRKFEELHPNTRRMYLGGHKMHGNNSTKGKGNSKIMCFANKMTDKQNVKMQCKSVKKDRNGLMISKPAQYVSKFHLANEAIRMLSVAQANKILKEHACCKRCFDAAGVPSRDFVDILNARDMCAICKKNTNIPGEYKFRVCRQCNDLSNNTELGGLMLILKSLDVLYRNYSFTIEDKKKIKVWRQDKKCYKAYEVDAHMFVRIPEKDVTLLFVFEQDEEEHMGKHKQDGVKMVEQTAHILASKVVHNGLDRDKVKIVMIRYCPLDTSGKNGYGRIERLVILRQWLIFAIQHCDELRSLSMWYMWYVKSNRASLLYCGNTFKEYGEMIHEAPASIRPNEEWRYCYDPYEGDSRVKKIKKSECLIKKKYHHIIDQRISTDTLSWSKCHETQPFPNDFEKVYEGALNYLQHHSLESDVDSETDIDD